MRSRRAALAGAGTVAVALVAGRAVPADAQDDPSQGATAFLPPPTTWAQIFWAVCGLTLESGTLRPDDRRAVARMRRRADEHARALESTLESFGATPPPRPRRRLEVPIHGFYEADSRAEHLRSAEHAARASMAAWYGALQQVRQPALLQLGAAIAAADAQHVVVLRALRGETSLQAAFATGAPE